MATATTSIEVTVDEDAPMQPPPPVQPRGLGEDMSAGTGGFGVGGCTVAGHGAPSSWMWLLGLAALIVRRRRR